MILARQAVTMTQMSKPRASGDDPRRRGTRIPEDL